MLNQNLLIIFIALAALATLIQAALIAGLYFGLLKANTELKRALSEAKRLAPAIAPALEQAEAISSRVTRATANFARR